MASGRGTAGDIADNHVDDNHHHRQPLRRDIDGAVMRVVRLALLIVCALIVQVAVFPHLRLFGVVPDLGLLIAVAVGYEYGAEAGALTGFFAGLGYDLFLETPLGLCALSYAIVGYFMGIIESGLFRSPRWLPSLLGAIGGLAAGLLFIAIGVLAGEEIVKGQHAVITISLAALYDALLAPLVFFLVRRVLGREQRVRDAWSMK
jgi:rod shape-determining protein MreD